MEPVRNKTNNACSVLLIDDERRFTDFLQEYVSQQFAGICLLVCNDPLKALPLLQSGAHDLILIDLEMPVLDGGKLLRFALQAGVDRNRIILLSSHDATNLHRLYPSGSCLAVLNKFEHGQREVLAMVFESLCAKISGRLYAYTDC